MKKSCYDEVYWLSLKIGEIETNLSNVYAFLCAIETNRKYINMKFKDMELEKLKNIVQERITKTERL